MTDTQPAALAADHPERNLEMVGRWYMVTLDGMATLCVDRERLSAPLPPTSAEGVEHGPQ